MVELASYIGLAACYLH